MCPQLAAPSHTAGQSLGAEKSHLPGRSTAGGGGGEVPGGEMATGLLKAGIGGLKQK